jgi:hypothetical protein
MVLTFPLLPDSKNGHIHSGAKNNHKRRSSMNRSLPNIFVCLAVFTLIISVTACGSDKTDNSQPEPPPSNTVENSVEGNALQPGESHTESPARTTQPSSVPEALKAMAASEGIYFGEIPEDFPVSFIPPFPGGEIQQASFEDDGEATLLQVVPVGRDEAFEHYRKHFKKLGWKSGDPMTIAGRTMVGFTGKDAQVDMTMMDRDGGKTFVALAYY